MGQYSEDSHTSSGGETPGATQSVDPGIADFVARLRNPHDTVVREQGRFPVHRPAYLPTSEPQGLRVAAVGEGTAENLREANWPVHLVPSQAGAEGLARALLAHDRRPRRVLFPASADALPTLSQELRAAGVTVDQIEAYRMVDAVAPTSVEATSWRHALQNRAVDAFTFASPSAVDRLRTALGDEPFAAIDGLVIAAIGPTTAAALRRNRISVSAIAEPSSLEGLAAATIDALARTNSPASRKATL